MSEKKKLERLITPVGEIKWAKVHEPGQFMKNGKPEGEPKFSIDLVFTKDDPDWKVWAAAIMEQIRKMPQQFKKVVVNNETIQEKIPKQVPIKPEIDKDDKPTGRFYVSFKTGEKFPPGVFDKYKRIIPKEMLIGNGSKGRVNYSPSEYEGFGGGIALYLNAVQVTELVEYQKQSAEAYGFDGEEPPTEGEEGHAPAEEEDRIPFNHRFIRYRRGHLHHRSPRRFRIV